MGVLHPIPLRWMIDAMYNCLSGGNCFMMNASFTGKPGSGFTARDI